MICRETQNGGYAYYKGETIVIIIYLAGGKYRVSVLFPNQKMGCISTFHHVEYAKICAETIYEMEWSKEK